MRSFLKLTFVQLKLFTREPAAFFFTLIFPLLLLVMFGLIFGNDPLPAEAGFGIAGYGYIDTVVPALTALIIGTVALLGLPVTTYGDGPRTKDIASLPGHADASSNLFCRRCDRLLHHGSDWHGSACHCGHHSLRFTL
ncbi:hypothetical protein MNBD_CHLOROFLEXI01-3545 [hydrothermal vent metagenome]|uniref:Uncharacterized protein n=1 Tax=hydrothermal vent metagenome TaxID=652676 RepID=A0A3B0ULZ5_9ZZZZ